MPGNSKTLLCGYSYDPLNRLVANTSTTQADTQQFYFHDRLSTEIQAGLQHSILQYNDQLLAQQLHRNGAVNARLLATDQQRSVAHVLEAILRPLAYSPYGHRPVENGLLGFTGEWPAPETGWYLLGKGYRVYNPVLMRFHSTDSWSPFDEGGINPYAYCLGDPVNREDANGHWPRFVSKAFKNVLLGRKNDRPTTRDDRPATQGVASIATRVVAEGLSSPGIIDTPTSIDLPTYLHLPPSNRPGSAQSGAVSGIDAGSETFGSYMGMIGGVLGLFARYVSSIPTWFTSRVQSANAIPRLFTRLGRNPSDYDASVTQIRKPDARGTRTGRLNNPIQGPPDKKNPGRPSTSIRR